MKRVTLFLVALAANVALSVFLWFVFGFPAFFLLLPFAFPFALLPRHPRSLLQNPITAERHCLCKEFSTRDAEVRFCPRCGRTL